MPEIGTSRIIGSGEVEGFVRQMVEETLAELGVVTSRPPSEGEIAVDNLFIVNIEGNPKLEVEYQEE